MSGSLNLLNLVPSVFIKPVLCARYCPKHWNIGVLTKEITDY